MGIENYSDKMTSSRTMGSETEYTSRVTGFLDSKVNPHLVLYYDDPDNLWLKNGARLYRDYGGVIEYATPECTSGSEIMRQERVGEQLVRNLGDKVIRAVEPEFEDIINKEAQVPVYKRTGYADVSRPNNVQDPLMSSGMTTGHHENYQTTLTRDRLETGEGRDLLNAYLATRVVWSGTGLVSALGYELSQKSRAIDFNGSSPVRHGDKMPYHSKGDGLIEIRLGEGNMSDWAIATKFDMTSLILRMMEHNVYIRSIRLKTNHENTAFRTASLNTLATIPTESGRYDAIDLQSIIAEEALMFGEKYGAPDNEIEAAKNVLKACADVQAHASGQEDISTISDRIDWAAKLHKIQSRGIQLGQISCSNIVAVAHDLAWEDLSAYGSARRWYTKYQPSSLKEIDIKRVLAQPVKGRAAKRVELLKEHAGNISNVDWNYVSLSNTRLQVVD